VCFWSKLNKKSANLGIFVDDDVISRVYYVKYFEGLFLNKRVSPDEKFRDIRARVSPIFPSRDT